MHNNVLIVSVASLALALPALASDRDDDIGRVQKATQVFQEIMRTPDKASPRPAGKREMRCHHSRRGEGSLHIRRQLRQGIGYLPH